MTETFPYADKTFEYVEGLDNLGTVEAVIDAMEGALKPYGFENFILTGLPNPQQRFDQMVVLKHWPQGWFDVYAKEDFVRVDPVIRMCRQTVNPFEWTEAPYDSETEPGAAEVMNRATEFRLSRGFSLPIHGGNGYEACFSMSGVKVDLTARTKPALHMMALYTFERVRRILGPRPFSFENPLTNREMEVLKWTAIGKTAAEIAEILSLTPRTVNEYAIRATRKMRAQNKTHAVVNAMQHKLIRL
jgi:LuxR family quorum sensing-dependent transcriptional regulator